MLGGCGGVSGGDEPDGPVGGVEPGCSAGCPGPVDQAGLIALGRVGVDEDVGVVQVGVEQVGPGEVAEVVGVGGVVLQALFGLA